ncbi:membrane protein insertion efficiency factor YidD [Candidatus Daviesbacteria bacterium]|nr:membrane protein insertion efficiency factor YidD [Candidatus Daviesbacteria bacterium]
MKLLKQLIIKGLLFYHKYLSFDQGMLAFLAPGGACKYNPNCSVYTAQMVERYGVVHGLKLGGRRFLSCR